MDRYVIPAVDWATIAPILIVICAGILGLILEMLRPKRNNNVIVGVSLVGLAAGLLSLGPLFSEPHGSTFAGMIERDQFGLVMQALIMVATFVAILFSEGYLREKRIAHAEFYPLALWAAAGGMIMVATKNMLMLFLGLEVLSISLYCLAGLSRSESKSEESALKYFLLGAFATAFLLYGIAFLYGASGSLDMSLFSEVVHTGDPSMETFLYLGTALVLVGLAFKAGLVPFHQWTPDVYQGAPTNVTAFMAAVSKIAAFGALVRLLDAASPIADFWFPLLSWIAIFTMFIGNLVALRQKDVKRALGYSSIAHAGYLLVAVLAHAAGPNIGLTSITYYLAGYSLMTIGAFAVVSMCATQGQEGTKFSDLHGLWRRSPFAATCLVLFMASLVGVPPTVGFFGKFFIFQDALAAGLAPLAIVLAINSVISVYYYLGIVQAAFVEPEGAIRPKSASLNPALGIAVFACAAGIFALGIFATPALRALSADGKDASTTSGAAVMDGGRPPRFENYDDYKASPRVETP